MDVNEIPAGLSVWERDVYQLLVEHVTTEAEVLSGYDELIERSSDHVRFLLELIAEDEARHHAVYERWVKSFEGLASLSQPEDGVPNLAREPEPEQLIPELEKLLAFEGQDAKELKDLQKRFKDYRRTTIWPLLSELMALDTQKHIRILEFLLHHAKQTARAGT